MQANGQYFLLEPGSIARRARLFRHVLMQTRFDEFTFSILKTPLKIGDGSFKPGAGSLISLGIRAEHQHLLHLFGNLRESARVTDAKIPAELAQHAAVVNVHSLAVLAPR